jgi:hypothetical protein
MKAAGFMNSWQQGRQISCSIHAAATARELWESAVQALRSSGGALRSFTVSLSLRWLDRTRPCR